MYQIATKSRISYCHSHSCLPAEIDKITDTLMNSFHPDSKPSFDSYIRRYKYNHLQMCFDAIDECDRGLFVACAVPTPTTSSELSSDDHHHHQQQQQQQIEQIIGFCSVDGRTPDPSCRIEFLTPSTLAGTSPRPYLSDLGVSTMHRRKGIGNMLVRACEHWAWSRGYDTLYLKVEKENVGAVRLYSALGYTKTKMQWDNDSFVGKKSFGGGSNILLMEKSMNKSGTARQNRTWI
jgi:ribosomal protein S18 acetylase RimI-like enzyme